jgi:hypothetical protein
LDVFSPWYNVSITMARCPSDDYQAGGYLLVMERQEDRKRKGTGNFT